MHLIKTKINKLLIAITSHTSENSLGSNRYSSQHDNEVNSAEELLYICFYFYFLDPTAVDSKHSTALDNDCCSPERSSRQTGS